MPPEGRRIFIADVHLDGQDGPSSRFFHLLLEHLILDAGQVPTELFILGDLFEFWEEYHPQVAERFERELRALESANLAGIRLVFLAGNRDFSQGKILRKRLGALLLGDGGTVQLADARRVWVEHGDLLCTKDTRYLRYRKWVRSWPVKTLYGLLPWAVAKKLMGVLIRKTKADKEKKPKGCMEVDLEAARRRLEETGCQILICGHTHAPMAADLGAGFRLLVLPFWLEVPAGYRERHGSLVPFRILPDGQIVEANAEGQPVIL